MLYVCMHLHEQSFTIIICSCMKYVVTICPIILMLHKCGTERNAWWPWLPRSGLTFHDVRCCVLLGMGGNDSYTWPILYWIYTRRMLCIFYCLSYALHFPYEPCLSGYTVKLSKLLMCLWTRVTKRNSCTSFALWGKSVSDLIWTFKWHFCWTIQLSVSYALSTHKTLLISMTLATLFGSHLNSTMEITMIHKEAPFLSLILWS